MTLFSISKVVKPTDQKVGKPLFLHQEIPNSIPPISGEYPNHCDKEDTAAEPVS